MADTHLHAGTIHLQSSPCQRLAAPEIAFWLRSTEIRSLTSQSGVSGSTMSGLAKLQGALVSGRLLDDAPSRRLLTKNTGHG